ncbi:MAG TPA: class I SAM-dependent methyltransferase [Streptosporangiaceae bacterium]|nr:class I SAM-dependent methyltransferase [Streptosporangiaceae bacterium]
MPSLAPELAPEHARAWIDRWDRQQEVYLPEREERFTAMIDAVAAVAGRPDPLVLDLGTGPGSLGARLLDRLPAATVVGVDSDPVLLALGRSAYGDRPGLRFADVDLRTADWPDRLGLDRPLDAAVSTTALHWLPEADLRRTYAAVAGLLRPGGLLLNGDHFVVDSPTLARLDRALLEREDARRFPGGHAEDWDAWWRALAADPALAGLAAERRRRWVPVEHHDSESGGLGTHIAALRDAGFGEVGTLWQRGETRLLCAVR